MGNTPIQLKIGYRRNNDVYNFSAKTILSIGVEVRGLPLGLMYLGANPA
jgi:hypothetical protein